MKQRQLVTGRQSVEQPGTIQRHSAQRLTAGLFAVLTMLIGSLTACNPMGPAVETAQPTDQTPAAQAENTESNTEPDTSSIAQPGTNPSADSSSDEERVKQGKLFEEGKTVYLDFQKRELEMGAKDKNPANPEWLSKYVTKSYYGKVLDQIKSNNASTYRLADDAFDKAKTTMRRVQKPEDNKADVALEACVDMTQVDLIDKATGKPIKKANLAYRYVQLKRADGTLKVYKIDNKAVSKCPF